MKKPEKYIEEINHFLYNLCLNEETSKTELTNFLNAYIKFILSYNQLPAEDISVQLHFVHKEKLNYEEDDFSITAKRKRKHKQRNRENAKKEAYKKGLTTLTYMSGCAGTNSFDIYLNNELCNIKSLNDLDKLIELLYNLGHEAEHIVQTYNHKELWEAVDIYHNKQVIAFDECVSRNYGNKKLLKELSKKFQQHSDNYNILNSTEILADQNSCYYFDHLASALLEQTEDDDYFTFISYIVRGVILAQDCREIDYGLWEDHDNLIKRCLIKKFGISADVLNII